MQQQRSLMVKNLAPGLPERGKIKIGRKGKEITSRQGNKFQPPQKLDHFLITTLERGQDGNFTIDPDAHEMFGEQPKQIPIRLLFDDPTLNFQSRYVAYTGKTMNRSCDGETCEKRQEDGSYQLCDCQCVRLARDDKRRCKLNGVLSVMIEGAHAVGGVWKFRTTSYNTVKGIMSSLSLIRSITGGPLAGLPLIMRVAPRTVVSPSDGRIQTVHIVSIEFAGTMEELKATGYGIALDHAKHDHRIEHIEDEARALLAGPSAAADDDVAEMGADSANQEQPAKAGDGPATLEPPGDDKPTALAQPDDDETAGEDNAVAAADKPKVPDIPVDLDQRGMSTEQSPSGAPLVDADGVIVKEFKRVGDYLNALRKMIGDAPNPTAVLDANSDVLNRIKQGKPEAAMRIAAIEAIVAERTADTAARDAELSRSADEESETEPDPEPQSQPANEAEPEPDNDDLF